MYCANVGGSNHADHHMTRHVAQLQHRIDASSLLADIMCEVNLLRSPFSLSESRQRFMLGPHAKDVACGINLCTISCRKVDSQHTRHRILLTLTTCGLSLWGFELCHLSGFRRCCAGLAACKPRCAKRPAALHVLGLAVFASLHCR